MRKKLIALILSAAVLSGCGEYITSGTVVEKHYEPSETTLFPVFTGKTVVPIPRTIPEKFVITIKNMETGQTSEVQVPQSEYEKIKVGDIYEGGAEYEGRHD